MIGEKVCYLGRNNSIYKLKFLNNFFLFDQRSIETRVVSEYKTALLVNLANVGLAAAVLNRKSNISCKRRS